jgi:2-deoxy-D-gluconate 3-dehydrogenase
MILDTFSLAGKRALVTGAGRGIGRSYALALAEAGADVAVLDVADAAGTAKEIAALGRKSLALDVDLLASSAEDLAAVVQKVVDALGGIDILVNNAGTIRRAPAVEHPAKDWSDVLQINLTALFQLSQSAGKHMLDAGSGSIINVASMLSYQGGINVPGYTASKHGVAGVTKALANEWASRGLTVNAIAPGYIATDNTAPLRADEKRSAEILARIPAARWGAPEDLQGMVVFLASDAARYVNGAVIPVDGGWLAR